MFPKSSPYNPLKNNTNYYYYLKKNIFLIIYTNAKENSLVYNARQEGEMFMKYLKYYVLEFLILVICEMTVICLYQNNNFNKKPIFIIEMVQEEENNILEENSLVDDFLEENKDDQESTNVEETNTVENGSSVKESTKPFSESKSTSNPNLNDTTKKNSTNNSTTESKKDKQIVQETVKAVEVTVQSAKEEEKIQEPKQEQNTQKTSVGKPVPFYESITHGIKEFYTESEAFNRGLEISKTELKHVMDHNQYHPDDQISPDINYYRVYPSYVDENNHTWYYLHFFCQSGEGNDAKLKELYGPKKK